MFYAAIIVVSCVLGSLLITILFQPENMTELCLTFLTACTALILLAGNLASAIAEFGSVSAWALILAILFAVLLLLVLSNRVLREKVFSNDFRSRLDLRDFIELGKNLSVFQMFMLLMPLLSLILLGLINLLIAFRLAPHEWDSLEYHLARLAYYLQNNSLQFFDANYWAQVIHPHNATILQAFFFLISNRNENTTQLVQLISYWITLLSVFGTARCLKYNVIESLFSASIAGLLIEALLESTTPENDLVVTCWVAAGLYFLLRCDSGQSKYLLIACMCIGIATGVKSSAFLAIPSIVVEVVYLFIRIRPTIQSASRKNLLVIPMSLLAFLLFSLSSGYADNLKHYNSALGPLKIRQEHSFEGRSIPVILETGSKNLARYAFSFLSLDGLKWKPFQQIQNLTFRTLAYPFQRLNIDLESTDDVRSPFSYSMLPSNHESYASWGIFGFSIIWPAVFFVLLWPRAPIDRRVMAVAAILFVFIQAFSSPYDQWRGRYFLTGIVFAAPLAGTWVRPRLSAALRYYLSFIILIGCFAAFSAVIFRDARALIRFNITADNTVEVYTILEGSRVEQMTAERSGATRIVSQFESKVPLEASVALATPRFYDFAFFGQGLRRKIIPINSFEHGLLTSPPDIDFMLFSDTVITPLTTDVLLGEDRYAGKIYLRKLE